MKPVRYLSLLTCTLILICFNASNPADAQITAISLNSMGTATGNNASDALRQSDVCSLTSQLTADGRFVLFRSDASDLVANDSNGKSDVFVRDRLLGTTALVSVSLNNFSGSDDSGCHGAAITPDGRFVAFTSKATNLVATPMGSGKENVFVRDLVAGKTTLISVNVTGTSGGNSESDEQPQISSDGRFVAFSSLASDLVPTDTNRSGMNGCFDGRDVFVRDVQSQTTSLVSANAAGTDSGRVQSDAFCGITGGTANHPLMTPDGHFVAFFSSDTDLLSAGAPTGSIFLRDVVNKITKAVDVTQNSGPGGISTLQAITPDGRFILFMSAGLNLGAKNVYDVFVRDMTSSEPELITINSSGTGAANKQSGAIAISDDGRFALFTSLATDLVSTPVSGCNVFLRDRARGQTTPISVDNSGNALNNSDALSMSGDARLIPFIANQAPQTVGNIFLRDRVSGITTPLATAVFSNSVERALPNPVISRDGSTIVFGSEGPLVRSDINNAADLFAFDVNLSTLPTADFQLGVSPQSATITPGSPAQVNISLQPALTAFDGTITLSCSGLPSSTSCSFTPSSTVMAGASVLLTIATSGMAANLATSQSLWAIQPLFAFMALCIFGGVFGSMEANGLAAKTRMILLLVAAFGVASCGGGSQPSRPQPPVNSTIVVIANSGSLQHSVNISLTIR